MSERVFCIDFGSAFTKVALRRDPSAPSEVVNSPTRRAEELDFCVPSVAVIDRTGTPHRAEFGPATANRVAGGGIEIHPNWKRHVFSGIRATGDLTAPPLDLLLQSSQLRELAESFGVSAAQVAHLRQLVVQARGLLGVPAAARAATGEAGWQRFASGLARHFFAWLRGYVMEACGPLRATGLNPEAIPVRLSVPAFAHGRGIETHPGCQVLTEAITRAGWTLHEDRPIVSEPYTNVMGVLTEGRNILSPRRRVQLGRMFKDGPIMLPLKDPSHHPAYRGWCIDVGAFTTDFAALTLDPKGQQVAEPDEAITVQQHSIPLGVSNLDEMILAVLPEEQVQWLRTTARPSDWDDFRTAVYTNRRSFRTAGAGTIGGTDRRSALDGVLADFAAQLSAACVRFRAELPPVKSQELILTGGGNCIPTVCQKLAETMLAGEGQFFHVYWPLAGGDGVYRRLPGALPRGGSALGGTSIYFERSFY